jgi:hypothetical protein
MSGTIVILAAWALAGAAIGAVHAALLYRSVVALAGASGAPALVALHIGRLGFVVVAFWLVARQGGGAPLIAAVAGFTLAQFAARRVAGRG